MLEPNTKSISDVRYEIGLEVWKVDQALAELEADGERDPGLEAVQDSLVRRFDLARRIESMTTNQ